MFFFFIVLMDWLRQCTGREVRRERVGAAQGRAGVGVGTFPRVAALSGASLRDARAACEGNPGPQTPEQKTLGH